MRKIRKIKCITCSKDKSGKNNGEKILGDLFVCKGCVNKILNIYIINNQIKWLCPLCKGESGVHKCQLCDLSLILWNAKNAQQY